MNNKNDYLFLGKVLELSLIERFVSLGRVYNLEEDWYRDRDQNKNCEQHELFFIYLVKDSSSFSSKGRHFFFLFIFTACNFIIKT